MTLTFSPPTNQLDLTFFHPNPKSRQFFHPAHVSYCCFSYCSDQILLLFTRFSTHHCFSVFIGSSTACIVVLDRRSHQLHTCNLGDSGFLVVRGGEVVHRSDEQQHYFNTPFQLSIAPPGAEGVVLSDRSVG